MPFDIPQELKEKAARCERGWACATEQGLPYCKVEEAVGRELAWVRCLHPVECPYQEAFGEGLICTCPVRLALWETRRI